MTGLNRKVKLSDYFALVIVARFFIWGFANINSCADAIINECELGDVAAVLATSFPDDEQAEEE